MAGAAYFFILSDVKANLSFLRTTVELFILWQRLKMISSFTFEAW